MEISVELKKLRQMRKIFNDFVNKVISVENTLKNALNFCSNERTRLDISKNIREGESDEGTHARLVLRSNGGNSGKFWMEGNNELSDGNRQGDGSNCVTGIVSALSEEKKIYREAEEGEGKGNDFEVSMSKGLPLLISLKRTENHLNSIETGVKEALNTIEDERRIFLKFIREWCSISGYELIEKEDPIENDYEE